MSAEFQHAFLLHGKDPRASTPLIDHFFNRYSEIRYRGDKNLSTLRERSRFFMGTMMLRICRIALSALSIDAEEAIFVGDHSYRDVCGAQAAGMQEVWLRRSGRETDRRSCPPDRTIHGLTDLIDWLLR